MSAYTGLAIAVAVSILCCQVLFALVRIDAWPFTSYPMFSVNLSVGSVAIYRAQLEDRYGRLSWWAPRHQKDKEELSFQFARILHDCTSRDAFKQRALRLITRLIVQDIRLAYEDGSENLPVRIRVVRRTVEFRDGEPAIREVLIYRVTLSAAIRK